MLYLLMIVVVGVLLALAVFRGLGKLRESSKLNKSSWKTFERVAKVRGLRAMEIEALRSIVRASKVKRPSQILGSVLLFDRCVDLALDKGAVSELEQGLLEGIRERLATATVVWDRHTDRREFERANCDLDIQFRLVSRDSMDEELKSSYQEGDEKFNQAFEELAAGIPSEVGHVQNLCAGGLGLLLSSTGPAGTKVGDYVSLESGTDPVPFSIDSLRGKVMETGRLEDEGKSILHLSFLPYELELRRQIIGVVYESAESAPKKSEFKLAQGTEKQGAKASPPKKKGNKTKAAEGKKGKPKMRPRRKKRRRPDAASKADGTS